MKKNLLIICLSLTLFAKANIHIVYLSCTGIVPATMSAVCGDTIKWVWGGCADSSVSTSIPSCATPWGFPVNSSSGTYEIVVACAGTYNYRCLSHAGVINVTCTATGVDPVADPPAHLIVYPNPGDGRFIIKDDGQEKINYEIVIYNELGEKIYSDLLSSGSAAVDISDHPAGIYFINIRSGTKVITEKLLIR